MKPFSRGKWTGAEEVYEAVCLAQCHHGLFSQAFQRFARRARAGDAFVAVAANAQDTAAADDSVGAANGDDGSGDPPGHLPADAVVAVDGMFAPASEEAWKKLMGCWLRTGLAWVSSEWLPRMIAIRLVNDGRRECLRRMLRTSTHRWERAQQLQYKRTGRRDFKVVLRYSGYYTDEAMHIFGSLGSEPSRSAAFPPSCRTSETRCLLFRLLARAAATMHELLVLPQRRQPYTLFGLVGVATVDEEEAMMRNILRTPVHLFDGWARNYVTNYHTVDLMKSDAARMELRSMVWLAEPCIGRLEAKHSRVRRLVKLISLQTHSADVETVSANFVGVNVRQFCEAVEIVCGADGVQEPRRSGSARRAFSAWNMFVHEKLKEKQSNDSDVPGPDTSRWENAILFGVQSADLAEEYRELSEADKARYARSARAATAAREAGRELPFNSGRRRQVRDQTRERLRLLAERPHLELQDGCAVADVAHRDDVALSDVVALPTYDLAMDLAETRKKVLSLRRMVAITEHKNTANDREEWVNFTKGPAKAMLVAVMPIAEAAPRTYLAVPTMTTDVLPTLAGEINNSACADLVVAAVSSRTSEATKLRQSLLENWEHKHRLIQHASVADLGQVPAMTCACAVLGTCVCRAPRSRRETWSQAATALQFASVLIKKATAAASSPYDKDDFRAVVEHGFQVLCLVGKGVNDEVQHRVWIHTSMLHHKRRPTFFSCFHLSGGQLSFSCFHLRSRQKKNGGQLSGCSTAPPGRRWKHGQRFPRAFATGSRTSPTTSTPCWVWTFLCSGWFLSFVWHHQICHYRT